MAQVQSQCFAWGCYCAVTEFIHWCHINVPRTVWTEIIGHLKEIVQHNSNNKDGKKNNSSATDILVWLEGWYKLPRQLIKMSDHKSLYPAIIYPTVVAGLKGLCNDWPHSKWIFLIIQIYSRHCFREGCQWSVSPDITEAKLTDAQSSSDQPDEGSKYSVKTFTTINWISMDPGLIYIVADKDFLLQDLLKWLNFEKLYTCMYFFFFLHFNTFIIHHLHRSLL